MGGTRGTVTGKRLSQRQMMGGWVGVGGWFLLEVFQDLEEEDKKMESK